MDSYNEVSQRKQSFFKLLQVSKIFSDTLIAKHPHISGCIQFKPALFKGQLYIFLHTVLKLHILQ